LQCREYNRLWRFEVKEDELEVLGSTITIPTTSVMIKAYPGERGSFLVLELLLNVLLLSLPFEKSCVNFTYKVKSDTICS
jgi:hypothetical protein